MENISCPLLIEGFDPGFAKALSQTSAAFTLLASAIDDFHLIISSHDGLKLETSDHACSTTLNFPVRLGQVADEALHLYHQARRRAREKPVIIGEALFDARAMRWHINGRDIDLTEKETAFLQMLVAACPEPIDRDTLLHRVWGYHPDVTTHTIETHLWRLRQKIEPDPSSPRIIITENGGYRILDVRCEK